MEFIQKVAGECIKGGATAIEWITTSGFTVRQEYRRTDVVLVNTKLMGQRRVASAKGMGRSKD